MRGITSAVAFAAVAAAVVTGPNAFAQEEVTPRFGLAPNVLQMGQHFEVQPEKGTCPGGTEHTTSPGFVKPLPAGDLHGIVIDVPGRYTATLKCKGSSKTGTAEFEVTDRRATPRFRIVPDALAPGQHFEVQIEKGDCEKGGRVVSAGFRAPLPAGDLHGIAVYQPGTYYAQLFCADHAYAGSAKFEVLAAAPSPSATPSATQKPRTPVVKPKGAPQTGGGGTA
jgi:hypothetical protein